MGKRSKFHQTARSSTAVKRWYTKHGERRRGKHERRRKREREEEEEEKKYVGSFPSPRRRSYNKTIVFRASGARSNKGAREVREYSSKQYFAIVQKGDDSRPLKVYRRTTFPRRSLDRLWIFDAVDSEKSATRPTITAAFTFARVCVYVRMCARV